MTGRKQNFTLFYEEPKDQSLISFASYMLNGWEKKKMIRIKFTNYYNYYRLDPEK